MRGSRILLGVIGRPHGVRGLVHVTSYADPPAAIASYGPLSDDSGRQFALCWRGEGIAKIVEIVGDVPTKVADRAIAETLTNHRLYVSRDRLAAPAEEEFYLADLVGLAAVDTRGAILGEVIAVHDYGAGASLEVLPCDAAPLLIPFTRASVPSVDIAAGRLVVSPPNVVQAPSSKEAAA